jgi:hypothetical protein
VQRAEQALELARALGNPDCLHWGFYALGRSLAPSEPAAACEAYEQAMRAAREVDSEFHAGLALVEWVALKRRLGGYQIALIGLLDLLRLLAVSGNRSQLSQAFREVGLFLADAGRMEPAALALLGRRGLPAMPMLPDQDGEAERRLDELQRSQPGVWSRLRVRAHAITEPELLESCKVELEDLRRVSGS